MEANVLQPNTASDTIAEDAAIPAWFAIDVGLALYRVGGDEERHEAKEIVWRAVTEWVYEIGPLKYYPGLIDELSGLVKKRLWDTDIDSELLEEAMEAGAECKLAGIGKKPDPETISYCRGVASLVLDSLGVDAEKIFSSFRDFLNEPEFYSTLIGLSLILASNF
ncbi:hypothetical protein ACSU1N_05370 [Thermogladius sp. 4427co]|uniref:hypothetical protein n=1 Tax=Thermogladius sp. 4427co TaxID=3450718 RepID=UPI003F7ABD03